MNSTNIKLFIGVLLFATWLGLVVFGVRGADDIITAIKAALLGLGVYHLGDRDNASAAPASTKDGGFASVQLLAVLALGAALLLTACATSGTQQTTQSTQVSYTQACAAYGGAFATALELRRAGKLSRSQIDQVTLIESQVTPLCTGALPADPSTAAQQITAAVTTLAILEAAK